MTGARCRLFGHRHRFSADGEVMRWTCERECGDAGSKRYATAADAARYAEAFNRSDRDTVGRRPTLSLLPLWAVRRLRGRSR